ncbi:alpha/beta fold hydrolase [Kutzneria buriramensis]|uniref:Pimeloyl-ACP methyl ester carboxylesterase n=1 Tax=Kutzneria buriramensis TaxID=1045776 RepID=A0A3E0GTY1_9PSEU|nr:alpha/beta hydrolase [Kutzneria buriramensis]REH27010.1 pimeloyl-ACP methyl ester carboxylesterase [Kutzneria buriramensis]
MNRVTLKLALAGLAGVLGAVPFAVGAAYQRSQTRKDDRELPGLGELVTVDRHAIHTCRLGHDNEGPTVLFESGLSSPLEMWTWIQGTVAVSAPTLSHDRAGVGWSESGPLPRTAERITAELELLLESLAEPGPFVLVGHSYGGMLLRHFAQRHPDKVAGVVLVDAAHPEQLTRSARQRLGLPLMRNSVRSSLFWSRFGLGRRTRKRPESQLDGLPEPARATTLARMMGTRNWVTTEAEVDAWLSHVIDETKDTRFSSGVPLYVLTAGETAQADPVHLQLQQELAELTDTGVHQVLPGVSHLGILCDQTAARHTAAVVLEVVDAARAGRAPKLVDPEPTTDQH